MKIRSSKNAMNSMLLQLLNRTGAELEQTGANPRNTAVYTQTTGAGLERPCSALVSVMYGNTPLGVSQLAHWSNHFFRVAQK